MSKPQGFNLIVDILQSFLFNYIMPSRATPLINEEYYHIFNRGVNKLPIFANIYDYKRFFRSMTYYQIEGPKPSFSLFPPLSRKLDRDKKIVEIVAFCLMPNHFHLLLKQVKDNGITEFLGKLSNSYTKYHNIKHGRVGPILQGEFKSVLVESNEQLLHLSRYIHLNPLVSGITKNLDDYIWSSYPEYLGRIPNPLCSKEIVLDQFKSSRGYTQFVHDQVGYAMELEWIKHQLFDREA